MGLDDWQHHGILHSQFWCVSDFVLAKSILTTRTVAELVSAYPTAGGMYYVTKHVVPKDRVAPWAWIVGWCNFLGQAGGVASLAYTISQMILATAVMHSPIDSSGLPKFSPTAVQTVLLAILILCLFGTICSFPTLWLHKVILWFAPINSEDGPLPSMIKYANVNLVLASIAICIALLVLTPEKQSAKWVFTEFTDGSGWDSKGFSFLLGFDLLNFFLDASLISADFSRLLGQ